MFLLYYRLDLRIWSHLFMEFYFW